MFAHSTTDRSKEMQDGPQILNAPKLVTVRKPLQLFHLQTREYIQHGSNPHWVTPRAPQTNDYRGVTGIQFMAAKGAVSHQDLGRPQELPPSDRACSASVVRRSTISWVRRRYAMAASRIISSRVLPGPDRVIVPRLRSSPQPDQNFRLPKKLPLRPGMCSHGRSLKEKSQQSTEAWRQVKTTLRQ